MKDGTPREHLLVAEINGLKYLVANPSRAGEAGGRAWIEQDREIQEASREQEFSIPITSFDEGAGYPYAKIPNVYDYADGWDASAPGKVATWPLRATGEAFTTTDYLGWCIHHETYFYAARGRYVVKYAIDDSEGAVWPILEIHDLGADNVIAGRAAQFAGKLYVPIYDVTNDNLERFQELTTVAANVVEQQTLTTTGTPTGGSYTVTFDGKTTAAIAYNANAAAVQAALRLSPGLEKVTVALTSGSAPNYTHTVTLTGAGGALGTASPPQFTVDDSGLTGGSSPAITPATTVAGTVDTWTLGPALILARCFKVWLNKLVRGFGNEVATVSGDPMTAGNWSAEYEVGDSSHDINDLAVYDRYLMVGKTDGLWSFDEGLDTQNELPDLQSSVDDDNCKGMEYSNGYLLVPHKVGLVRWRPGSYEFVGAGQEGDQEGDISRGWGRVAAIAPYGKYAWVIVNDTYHTQGAVTSLQPAKGSRYPTTPHTHHLTAAGENYEGSIVLASLSQPATPQSPATWSDDNAVGAITWADTGNAEDSDDAYATAGVGVSHYLKGLDPDFNVPSDATIRGILVEIERKVGVS